MAPAVNAPPAAGRAAFGPRRAGGRRGPSGRGLTQRVHTAGAARPSSTRWLERQLNDPYVAEAQRHGYRSRAAFKLLQLDDRFHLLGPGKRVVDLGAAPGGWTQVAVERVSPPRASRQAGPGGRHRPDADGADRRVPSSSSCDFLDREAPAKLKAALGGPADLVLSDMAAPATGHARPTICASSALAEAAHAFAIEVLKPGGAFVAKVLQGGATQELLAALKRDFAEVRHVKPAASRADSAEIYVVALGFRAPVRRAGLSGGAASTRHAGLGFGGVLCMMARHYPEGTRPLEVWHADPRGAYFRRCSAGARRLRRPARRRPIPAPG